MLCCCQIWKDIIIPLISALIGGGLTLVGVIITIRHTNKTIPMFYCKISIFCAPCLKFCNTSKL